MNQNKSISLGDGDDSIDDVDAFGLDQFGAPSGLSPMWGAVAGSGLGTVTAMGLRRFASGGLNRHAEAVGFGVAAAASGAMIMMRKTRAAGWTALAAAFLNNGLRSLEQYFLAPGGMSGVVIEPTTAFRGSGMGLVEIEPTTAFRGHGLSGELPQLVGASLQSASDHVQLVGGPALSGIASHWGHTHFAR